MRPLNGAHVLNSKLLFVVVLGLLHLFILKNTIAPHTLFVSPLLPRPGHCSAVQLSAAWPRRQAALVNELLS